MKTSSTTKRKGAKTCIIMSILKIIFEFMQKKREINGHLNNHNIGMSFPNSK